MACGHACLAPCHSPYPCKEDKACQHKILITCKCQRIKQEARCNASKTSEGNRWRKLKCDDECARLERNREWAVALKVDPAARLDDHIPYSDETMDLYQANPAWAAAQEDRFRVFAANANEKRLRFKPMPARQRAFLHSIGEDFGLDLESMDPEPHRHVAVFKTAGFVMAPTKTVADCVQLRRMQREMAAAALPAAHPQPSRVPPAEPFNGFLLTSPRFALTIDEIHSAIKPVVAKTPFALDVLFLPSNDAVALRPAHSGRPSMSEHEVHSTLERIKAAISKAVSSHKVGNVQLCRLDTSLNVVRLEADSSDGNAGWSQVAASKGNAASRAAAEQQRQRAMGLGGKGGYAVLRVGGHAVRKETNGEKEMKKKRAADKVEVADDWEAAELEEERKERDVSQKAAGAEPGPPATADSGLGSWADMADED